MKKWLLNIFLLLQFPLYAQVPLFRTDTSGLPATTVKKRQWLIGGASAVVFGGSFVLLNKAWYKDYPRSSFHTFNDAGEWKQVDKVGHAWTAYSIARATTNFWEWTGTKPRTSLLLGSATSLAYLLSIEYLDGRSAQWGWSWADAGADIFGTSLAFSQYLAWGEQKMQLKFSAHTKKYAPSSLEQRADELFGNTIPERLLKDYNQQTYWLSMNLNSMFRTKKFPEWLNLAVGYGAEGLFGGYENLAYDKNGSISFDRRDIKRYRQWYLAPDIDLTKIKTRSKFMRLFLSAANIFKMPAPAFELSNGKFHVRAIAF